jgi:hypothetical protein
MNTTARLITVLVVSASSACGGVSPTTPPVVVALARASQDDSLSELAAGLALEAGHWLVNRNDTDAVGHRSLTRSKSCLDGQPAELTAARPGEACSIIRLCQNREMP